MVTVKMMLMALFVFASVLTMGQPSLAQHTGAASEKHDLANRWLENVRIEEENIAGLFSHLSSAYDIPLGLEIALGNDERSLYRVHFERGTLADLLTRFVAEHKEYAWKIENGVVSIFPKDGYRDPVLQELLSTEISSFSVKEKTDVSAFGKKLLSAIEVKRILDKNEITYDTGSLGGFYIQQLGQKFSFEVSNTNFKSILDKVITESPVARSWVVSYKIPTRNLLLRVNSGIEYLPKNAKGPRN